MSALRAMAANESGYTTLSVAESRRDVSVGASSCRARSVTEDNVPLGRARAKVPKRSVSAAVIRWHLFYFFSFWLGIRRINKKMLYLHDYFNE